VDSDNCTLQIVHESIVQLPGLGHLRAGKEENEKDEKQREEKPKIEQVTPGKMGGRKLRKFSFGFFVSLLPCLSSRGR